MNIPLLSFNDLYFFNEYFIDIFDYIQNWSPFKTTKNPHAEFTYVIDKIPFFYLEDYPLYYQNFIYNDYIFADSTSLILSYKIHKSFINDYIKEFPPYFLDYIRNNFDENKQP